MIARLARQLLLLAALASPSAAQQTRHAPVHGPLGERMDEPTLRMVLTEKRFGVAKARESLRAIEAAATCASPRPTTASCTRCSSARSSRRDIGEVSALMRAYSFPPPRGQWEWVKDADRAMKYREWIMTG